MISGRNAHRVSLFFAAIILGLTAVSLSQPPAQPCGNLAKSYQPIIAFELARNVGDLHAIFGETPGACRSAIAHQMDQVNTVDSDIFIPAYGLFLIFFFAGLRARAPAIAGLAIAITVAACAADYVENYALFHLSPDPDHDTWIALLIRATETKWIGLGVAGALAIPLLRGRWAFWPSLPLCGAGLVATMATLVASAAVGPFLSNAIVAGWLLFLAVDLGEAFRRQ